MFDKYTKLSNSCYLNELIEEDAPKKEIERCKNVQQGVYDAVKETLYNNRKNCKK